MYNLFVKFKSDDDSKSWDSGVYECDRSRFLEYTTDELYHRFKDLTKENIEDLKSIPCIFAYEGKYPIKIGRLTSIEPRNRVIRIKYEFYKIKEIDFSLIEPILMELDISDWEMNRTHWAVKDEILFNCISKITTIPQNFTDKSESIKNTISNDDEIKVKSLGEFINKILLNENEEDNEIFYRGHSDKDFKLVPRLMRTAENGEYSYKDNENVLYNELIISNPSDFVGDERTIERLIRMQHYSLPTRLLDITSNPLIALYFACLPQDKKEVEKEGEVISFSLKRDKIKYFDSDTVSCIANLARISKDDKNSLENCLLPENKTNKSDFNKLEYVKRLSYAVRQEAPFFKSQINPSDLKKIICVKGKKSNSRIYSQSGAFLLFGIDAIFNEKGDDDIKLNRIVIKNKNEILKDLDLLNINASTVFPYIENSAKYIRDKYKLSK